MHAAQWLRVDACEDFMTACMLVVRILALRVLLLHAVVPDFAWPT
jgi:hypothetical protein